MLETCIFKLMAIPANRDKVIVLVIPWITINTVLYVVNLKLCGG